VNRKQRLVKSYKNSINLRETQHVEVEGYGLAYTSRNIDKEPLEACPHLN